MKKEKTKPMINICKSGLIIIQKNPATVPLYRALISLPVIIRGGGTEMGDKGKKDKGKREMQKQAKTSKKEKRKIKKEKKQGSSWPNSA